MISIPELRLPTDEELRVSAEHWLKPLRPCLYENWPEALRETSFRTASFELGKPEILALLDAFDGQFDQPILNDIAAKIDAANQFTDGFYAKLSSRSPKDSFHAFNHLAEFRCRSGADVINLFSGSERILDDLCRYRVLDIPCLVLLREFEPIPPQEEWRCFIRNGEVVGISQYFYHERLPEQDRVVERITQFLETAVLPVLHIDAVVVDVWLRDKPLVIEINPYGLSDPCLFTYPELEGNEFPLFRAVSAPRCCW